MPTLDFDWRPHNKCKLVSSINTSIIYYIDEWWWIKTCTQTCFYCQGRKELLGFNTKDIRLDAVQVRILYCFLKRPSAMQIMFVIHDLFSIPVVFYFIHLHRYKVDCSFFSLNGEVYFVSENIRIWCNY